MTHTKADYQKAIDFIKFKENQDYIETEEYYHIFKYHGDSIKSALQLAIDLQPRPIEELKTYAPKNMNIVLAQDHTHFYDLSALPKPNITKSPE